MPMITKQSALLTTIFLSFFFTKSASRPSTAIRNVQGKCVDVHAPDINNNGAYVQVWDCNNAVQQTFYFTESGQIKSAYTGDDNCLDVHDPQHTSGANGAKVQMWDCNGEDQQQWFIDGNAIKSSNGKCLDVHAPDITNNGGKIQLWDCNGAAQQQWSLTVTCAAEECCTDVDCNDNLVCNGDETCENGVCVAGTSLDCGFAFVCDDDENKCVRDCDSFAIDDYLECSSKFDDVAHNIIPGINSRIDGVDTRIDGVDTRITGVDTRIDGVDIMIDNLETTVNTNKANVDASIADLNDKFDRFSASFGNRFDAQTGSINFMDVTDKSPTSLFNRFRDMFIIGLLVVNLIFMIGIYYKCATNNRYSKVEVFSDSESQRLRN